MLTKWCLSGKECATCRQVKGFTLRWQSVCGLCDVHMNTNPQVKANDMK